MGDALGAGYEGGLPLTGRARFLPGGICERPAGQWTDDTAQTYAIAQVAAKFPDLREPEALDAIAARFVDWYLDNPPDVGIQTRIVLNAALAASKREVPNNALDSVGDCERDHQLETLSASEKDETASTRTVATSLGALLTTASKDHFTQTGRAAGNGSLMRTAPVALAYLGDGDAEAKALVEAAMAVSALTHGDPLAGQACALWCLEIHERVKTGTSPGLLAHLRFLPDEAREFWAAAIKRAETEPPGTFRPNGFVVTALQAAWASIIQTPPNDDLSTWFTSVLNAAIGIGDDTDTVAAIAGAVVGAQVGAEAIPAEWVAGIFGWPPVTGNDAGHGRAGQQSDAAGLATLAAAIVGLRRVNGKSA